MHGWEAVALPNRQLDRRNQLSHCIYSCMPYDRSMLKIKNINCTIAASSSSLVDLYLQTAIYSSAMAALRRLYLSVYNWAVCFGWSVSWMLCSWKVQVLYNAASALLESRHDAVYPAVERPLLFAQTTAFLEILHSILGFVRSPISVTLPQISGRLYVTWGILWSFPETHSHILVTSLIISWSITEIIRYSFFGMREAFGFAPSWLLWLRYSTFLVFYPIGLISEVGLIYVAMPSMKASEKYCFRMPNKWNLSFDYRYMSVLLTALYVPGFPYLFRYMVAKREKALSKTKTA